MIGYLVAAARTARFCIDLSQTRASSGAHRAQYTPCIYALETGFAGLPTRERRCFLFVPFESALESKMSCVVDEEEGPRGSRIDCKGRVMEFIEFNIQRRLTLADLASVAAMSAYHFARSFKRWFGVTPHQHLALRRVERAKQLLRERDIPLAEVAHACGYASQSHMTTAFKRVVGVSPGQYRRQQTRQ